MTSTPATDRQRLAAELVAASRAFWALGWALGWALATSSNFSARLEERAILVTASGLDKGELTEDGLLVVDLEGAPVPPSLASSPPT